MLRLSCGCPEAHVHVSPCSDPLRCHGSRHHALQLLRSLPPSDIETSLLRISAADDSPLPSVRAAYLRSASSSTCPPDCQCSCHLCHEECYDYSIARRNEHVRGVLFFSVMDPPMCVVDGVGVRTVEKAASLLRESSSSHPSSSSSSHPVSSSPRPSLPPDLDACFRLDDLPPPPDGASLLPLRVGMRMEESSLHFDTLLVSVCGTWSAMHVSFPSSSFLLPLPSSSSRTYANLLAHYHLFGNRQLSSSSPSDWASSVSTADRWFSSSSQHPMHALARSSASDEGKRTASSRRALDSAAPSSLLLDPASPPPPPTRTSVHILVRMLHDHGARMQRTSSVCEEAGRDFLFAGKAADDLMREGAMDMALDLYHDLWYMHKQERA